MTHLIPVHARFLLRALIFTGLLCGGQVIAWAGLLPYATLPASVESSTYHVSIDGQPIFVEAFGEVSIARFAFVGTVNVRVSIDTSVASVNLSPIAYKIASMVDGNDLSFSLSQPRALVININGLHNLLLLADGPEVDRLKIGDAGVIDFSTYLAPDRDPDVEVTTALQAAIDATAALNGGNGGTLYIPDGLYYAAQFRLKTNVRLHLSDGARIRAINDFSTVKYPRQNNGDSSFVYIDSADNVKITGRGVLDGNGWNIRHSNDSTPGDGASDGGNCKLIRSRNCTNLLIEGVYLRDSARWTLHPLYSDHVAIRNIKIINDLRTDEGGSRAYVSNTDGIDVDACDDVLVDGCFIYTEDDTLTPKVTNYMNLKKPCTNVTFVNNVLYAHKAAVKVGSELKEDIDGVTIANNEVILADRFLALWADYGNSTGHTIRNVLAENNRTENIGYRDNRCFFYFKVMTNDEISPPKPGHIQGIVVDGLFASTAAPRNSRIFGYDASHLVDDVTIKNMYKSGLPVSSFSGIPIPFDDNNFYTNIKLVAPGGSERIVRSGTPSVSTETVPITAELPRVEIRTTDAWGLEGVDSVGFVVSRVGLLSQMLSVRVVASGSAGEGGGYTALPESVDFAPGVQQVFVSLMPLADEDNEDGELLTLSIVAGDAYDIGAEGSASATIMDLSTPELSISSVDDALGTVSMTFDRPRDSFGAAYVVESSQDLATWSVDGISLEKLSSSDDSETWAAISPLLGGGQFFRLRMVMP